MNNFKEQEIREERSHASRDLGELSPHQLKICLLDEGTRNLIPIKYSENIDELIKLFSSAEEKRNLVTEE